jgi:hypothetical protein
MIENGVNAGGHGYQGENIEQKPEDSPALPLAAKSADNWKLLTVTHGGTVSLVKGLSETKARELADNLLHWAYRSNQTCGAGPIVYRLSDGDIIRTEAFE